MAYIDRSSAPYRAPILVAIGLIHAGAIYALVTGLSGIIPQIIPETRSEGTNIPLPQPTPAEPRPQPRTAHQPPSGNSQTSAPSPANPLPTGPIVVELGTNPAGGGRLGPIGPLLPIEPIPTPSPQTALPPKLAHPIGKPGLWVTPNDYPAADLRAEREGTTRFRLTIGADGKVADCEITRSSGHPSLDAAACANLRKRARFVAATDASGAAVPGTYSSAVRWTIPQY